LRDDIAHTLALEHLADQGQSMSVNLGSGNGFSIKELLAATERIVGAPVPYTVSARRAGDPPRLVADATRAKIILDWQTALSDIAHILCTAWIWAKKNYER